MLSKKFICASSEYSTFTKFVPSPLFRKAFFILEKPLKCTVTVGTPGFYDVFINGQKITKGILSPYISNPDHMVYYDEYDITEYVSEGKNILGLQLGNGMQNSVGGEIWDFEKADFRGAPSVAFAVEITDNDGSVTTYEADESVKTAPSPVIFDDLRCGCFYDARLEMDDWSQVRFSDDNWKNAQTAPTPRGEKRLCSAEPVVATRHMRPISVTKCRMNEFVAEDRVSKEVSDFPSKERDGYLYDFGINSAGIVRLKIKGYRGQKIDLQFGECFDNNGNPDYSNIKFFPEGFSQRDIYICKGEEEEIFEPQFTYHGFRYVVVLGITPEQATDDLITYIVCNSALEERGNFNCSDTTLNRLQAMSRNATLSNFYYFPTDCPHREKNGWTGDAVMSCRQTLLNLSPEKSYKEWLRNIRKAQTNDGAIPGVVPTDTWGYGKGFGPAWDAVLVILPYLTWRYRGDEEILKENANAIFNYITYLSSRRTKRGTVDYGLGDWCAVNGVKAPIEFTSTVVAMDNVKKSAEIFRHLGLNLQGDFCDKLYKELKTAARKYLVDLNTMTAIGNCQTSQSMAIYYDVFEPGEKQQAFKVLLDIIKENDEHIDFGFIGILSVFRVLCEFNEYDLAYKMIAREDFPSFGNWVKQGYTALGEIFAREGEKTESLNHHCYADISAIFIEYFAGIRVNPYGDDCKEVNIQPCFVGSLSRAAAFHKTSAGIVGVNWERKGDGIKIKTEKCPSVYGKILLPQGYVFEDTNLSYRSFDAGEYTVVKTNSVPENIIEV